MLQTAVNLNEFQYETLLLASGIMQKYGGNTTFSRWHLESLKIQLQENTEIYFTSTKLERNGRNYYFISLNRPRYPNPRLQVYYNNDRLLRPRAHRLEPNHHHIIERLCHERRVAENYQQPPALIDEVNDNELALVTEEDIDEQADNEEQQHVYMLDKDMIAEDHIEHHQNNLLIDEEIVKKKQGTRKRALRISSHHKNN
jgi:hypothetical protein